MTASHLVARLARVGIAMLAMVAGLSARASAQTIRATVSDRTTDRPLADVRITLLDQTGKEVRTDARTDSLGTFTAHVGWAGQYRIVASRIGYSALTSDPVDVELGELVVLRLQMTSAPALLPTVRVVERRRLHQSELMTSGGFDLRLSRGVGTFVTADQLAEMGRRNLREILAGWAPNVLWIQSTENGEVLAILKAGYPQGCAPEIFLDGLPLSTGVDIETLSGRRVSALDALSGYNADQLHGIEIYRWAQMPPTSMAGLLGMAQQEGLSRDRYCGVVAVWTKHGVARTAANPRRVDGRPAVQVIRGTVVNQESQRPVADVLIRLADEKGKAFGDTVRSDSAGRFIVRTTRAGPLRVTALGAGIRASTSPVLRVLSEELIIVRLFVSDRRVAAPLGVAGRTSPRDFAPGSLAAFNYRRERAIGGTFLGAEAVRASNVQALGELVARQDPGGRSTQGAAARCVPTWFLNGSIVAADAVAGLQSMALATVVGLEMYASRDDAPEVFSEAATGDCPIIAVWTTSAR